MTNLMVCNLVTAALTAVIGVCIAVTSYGYGIEFSAFGPGAGFWPFLLALGLLVVAGFIVFDTLHHKASFLEKQVILLDPACLSVYKIMGLVVAYIVLIYLVGFYASTLLFMVTMMKLLGAKRYSTMFSVTLIFLAIIYVVFGTLLHISLPLPFFME